MGPILFHSRVSATPQTSGYALSKLSFFLTQKIGQVLEVAVSVSRPGVSDFRESRIARVPSSPFHQLLWVALFIALPAASRVMHQHLL